MLSPMVYGEVKGGKLIADEPELLKQAFRCHEGRRVTVEVRRFRKARSMNQNAYYHGVIVKLVMDVMGEDDPVAAHEVLKFECNSEIRTIGKGEDRREYRHPLSTALLSTVEFEAYTDRFRMFAARFFGIYIPLPNEVAI